MHICVVYSVTTCVYDVRFYDSVSDLVSDQVKNKNSQQIAILDGPCWEDYLISKFESLAHLHASRALL